MSPDRNKKLPPSNRPPPDRDKFASVGVFKSPRERWLLALCGAQLVLLIVLSIVWAVHKPRASPVPQRATVYSSTNREPFFLGQPGPWGELEYARINIEPPDDFMPEDILSFEKTRWFFPEFTSEQLMAFFQDCGLTDAQRAELLNPAGWTLETNGIVVVPSSKLVLELIPSARTQIYSILARNGRNEYHFWPYTYRHGGFDEWFEHAGLSPATLDLLRRLVYPRGAAICFSDIPELVPQIPTVAERKRLIKALFRNSTLLMKVRIRPDTDVKALTHYWGAGRRTKDIAPLLDSLTRVNGSITIDVAHLLPAFARKRLYTYPITELLAGETMPDCYWTAMNFFNDPPDNRYHDEKTWSQELHDRFMPVTTPTCGDLIFLLNSNNVPIHAAVYVADNTVFSKNGGHYRQPWILMKMEDMLARYPENFTVNLIAFRAKPHP